MQSQIPITILGVGLIGKRHVDHVLKNPRTKLHSIVDPTIEGVQLASELGVPIFISLEALTDSFATSKPQGAIIATPSHLHVPQALTLLKHGIHLLIEKPICIDVASGQKLLQAASLPDSPAILSGYHKRFNPYILALKSLLDSNKLGRIVAVQGTWAVHKPREYFTANPWRTQAGSGGTMLINLSHEVDLFRYLFGDITRVYLELGEGLRGHDVDETGAVTLRFASGAVGTFVFSDHALTPFCFEGATGENPDLVPYSGKNVYRVLGSKGSVELPDLKRYWYDGEGEGHWSKQLSVDGELSPERNPEGFVYNYENAPFTRRLEHWVGVMQGVEEPNCSLRDGVMATRVLDALQESAVRGVPVEIGDI